ncbi:tail fiber domain-containing protein [Dyadobacter sp. 676]|uniref:Tail fiber domain-containing protein n=1 Tax=Dyadobacter sp. 676 TaxID=3088362 RepID=A0AAU8FDM9_9BACT
MKMLSFCMMLVLWHMLALAQVPEQFSFQGVARKADGKLASNANVGIRVTIRSENSSGTVVYQETHTVQTNAAGIFNIPIGGGTVVSGAFGNISWQSFPHFLQLEMDPEGGTTYIDMGTTQLLSVPYATQAKEATKWHDGYPVVQKMQFGPDIDINDPDVVNDPDLVKYLLPSIDEGNRLIWYPLKGAFRAGSSVNGKWEGSEMGEYSAAFGSDNSAKGLASIASGVGSSAAGSFSAAIGFDAFATGHTSTAFGFETQSNYKGSFVVGMFNAPQGSGGSNAPSADDAIFQVGNGTAGNNKSNAVSVLRNGNTGIKLDIDSPGYPLDVGGRIRTRHDGATTSGIHFNNSQNVVDGFMGMKTDAQIGFWINNAWRFWIDNAGNGTLGGTLSQGSDRRLKRDITPLSASLGRLTGLNGYHYYWKDKERDQSLQTGLIAQDVEVLFPELVRTDEKGFKSLNYMGLIPHLIESVKELAKQNARLEAENASFKVDNKVFRDQLTSLESKLDQLLKTSPDRTAK